MTDAKPNEMPDVLWAVMLNGEPKPVDTPANAMKFVRADLLKAPEGLADAIQNYDEWGNSGPRGNKVLYEAARILLQATEG